MRKELRRLIHSHWPPMGAAGTAMKEELRLLRIYRRRSCHRRYLLAKNHLAGIRSQPTGLWDDYELLTSIRILTIVYA